MPRQPTETGQSQCPEALSALAGMGLSAVSVLAMGLGGALHRLQGNEAFPWSPLPDKNHRGIYPMGFRVFSHNTLIPASPPPLFPMVEKNLC